MQKLISVMLALTALGQAPRTEAQTFLGNNQPGGGSSFGFSLAAGITNISLVATNSSVAFSYLYLKRGGNAALTNYDFVSRLNQTTNSITNWSRLAVTAC